MYLSARVFGNLNRKHWDRRVWEIGYRGPQLPQQKATGRPDYPVSGNMVAVTRERLAREMAVMHALARPFIDQATESSWLARQGVSGLQELRTRAVKEAKAAAMPGKPKHDLPSMLKKKGNIGNSLHSHTTVEQSLGYLTRRNRWD